MKKGSGYVAAFALFLLAALFTLAVRTVDVAAVGPLGTEVGFSGVNTAFFGLLGFCPALYGMTQLLGKLSLLTPVFFAGLGLYQLVRRKSLRRVDRCVLALAGLYAATGALYVLFEKAIVNYRPVLMPGCTEPEASFPSSHTMLACAVLGSVFLLLPCYFRGKTARLLRGVCALVIALIVIGRLFAGVPWLTDVVGGVLYGAALLRLYAAAAFPEGVPAVEPEKK